MPSPGGFSPELSYFLASEFYNPPSLKLPPTSDPTARSLSRSKSKSRTSHNRSTSATPTLQTTLPIRSTSVTSLSSAASSTLSTPSDEDRPSTLSRKRAQSSVSASAAVAPGGYSPLSNAFASLAHSSSAMTVPSARRRDSPTPSTLSLSRAGRSFDRLPSAIRTSSTALSSLHRQGSHSRVNTLADQERWEWEESPSPTDHALGIQWPDDIERIELDRVDLLAEMDEEDEIALGRPTRSRVKESVDGLGVRSDSVSRGTLEAAAMLG